MYTGPGLTHDGIVFPVVDLRVKLKSLSWGVSFVAVHSKDLTECKTSGSTSSQSDGFSFLEWRVTWMAFHNVPFNFST